MMYNNKLSVCVKVKGKVLREIGDTVYIPFGSEYEISIKNLNTVKALVDVSIDGKSVSGESSFVVYPNSTVDLKRFVTNDNMQIGNAFKFIERTEQIEDHRGITHDDGLIRVEYEFEKVVLPNHYLSNYHYRHPDFYCAQWRDNSVLTTYAAPQSSVIRSASAFTASNVVNVANEVGITVPGSLVNQEFSNAPAFATDGSANVIVIKLLGKTPGGDDVSVPVTVKTKPTCTTCGKTNKATANFCAHCGTSLTLV